jgi:DNA-binding SARP family transcriptional activator
LERSDVTVRVYVTGRVQIESAGRRIDEPRFPARQGRALFVYLVCHRHRPVTRAELAQALWPDTVPSAWEAALNAIISKLRALLKGIEPSRLSVTSAFGAYLFHAGDDVWIDREAAAAAIDEAEGLLHADRWREAWPLCNIAAITARQPFLPGDEGEWIGRERARLHGILVRALDCLSDIWLLNGDPSLAIGAAREAVALEPFREAGYQRLMRLHAARGDRAEALRVYENCRRLLAEELGVEPSPETTKIYERLKRRTPRP